MNEKCYYGCGLDANYVIGHKQRPCCCVKQTKCTAIRQKNSKGLKESYDKGERLPQAERVLSDDAKRRQAWRRGQCSLTDKRIKLKHGDVFTTNSLYSSTLVKKYMVLNGTPNCCNKCKLTHWLENVIKLELHHINGDNRDNRLENLELLCPNCHSFTGNFRGRNIKRKPILPDAVVVDCLKRNNFNRRKTLIELGLSPKGGNYTRLNKFMVAATGFEPVNNEF